MLLTLALAYLALLPISIRYVFRPVKLPGIYPAVDLERTIRDNGSSYGACRLMVGTVTLAPSGQWWICNSDTLWIALTKPPR